MSFPFNLAGNYYAIGDVCTHDDGFLGDGMIEWDYFCGRAEGIEILHYPIKYSIVASFE